jgi:predicted dehydrogenase/nucleoside-diphosphate-sugar epimerase
VATPPFSIAVIGCGTMAEQFHLPVLAGHEQLRLAVLVDRNLQRARQLASRYGVEAVADIDDLQPGSITAAVIATPPYHHHPGAVALMRRAVHVLVEKPMAFDAAQAQDMVATAEQHGVVLSIGVYRRLLPVTRLLRALIEREDYGRPLRFSVEWGGLGGFASATLGLLRKELAGGGVLIDLGSHVFDQLLAVFGGDITVERYRDDSRGGVEADCEARLRVGPIGAQVEGVVRLSRVRSLSGRIEIECEHATLSTAISDRFEVTVRRHDRQTAVVLREAGATDVSWFETYRAEIDDFVKAIADGSDPQLSGSSVLPTVRAIDACYRQRQPLALPWLDVAPLNPAERSTRRKRVLITGAGGFIGGRAAEMLSQSGEWDVRALVRQPAHASRVARLAVDLVQGDLKSDPDVERALEGCDAVLHAAIGTAYGQPKEIHAVTVAGTARLAASARRRGIERFVHISTIGVHDSRLAGIIDETTPIAPSTGDGYGSTKALAEAAVRREETLGLSVAIVRPGCVYGPYGFTFVINPLRALARGRLAVMDAEPANTVFVDNLVEALRRALLAPPDAVRGQAFPISDGDSSSWIDYYGFFARQIGTAILRDAEPPVQAVQRRGFFRGVADVLLSPEGKGFAKRVLNSDPMGTLPRWALERFPSLEPRLREAAGMNEPDIYRRPQPAPGGIVRFSGWKSPVSIVHAERRLGYNPAVPPDRALALTWDWAQYARIV